MKPEFIYVVRNDAFPGFCKIGRATSLSSRLSAYNVGDPFRGYTYAGFFPVHDGPSAEAAAHRLVRGHRVLGEWFRLHPYDALSLLSSLPQVKEYASVPSTP